MPQKPSAASTERQRRTGPRSDIDVRLMVIDAAEQLFDDEGFGAVSLRQVARAAGVAPTAVAYHFQDRDGLLHAVLVRRGHGVMSRVHTRLADVVDAPATPTPTDLVRALLDPYVELLDEHRMQGLRWVRLMYILATSDHPVWRRAINTDHELATLYRSAFARVLPEVRPDDVPRLANLTVYAMLGVLARADQPGFGAPLTSSHGLDGAFTERLVRFGSAGIVGAVQGEASP